MMFFRKLYWYATAYMQKHGWLILGAVFLGAILFSLLFRLILAVSQFKQTQYVGRIGVVTLATLPRDIQEKMSNGLTLLDDQGKPSASLSERWTVEDEGKTYRFIIRKGLKWQDGKEVEPKDLQYNFSDTQIITNENEIVFKLKEPFIPFPVVVSQPVFRETTARKFMFFSEKRIIGTGSYKLVRLQQEGARITELEIESTEERLVYRFYPTESRATLAFQRGEIDILQDMSNPSSLQDWKNAEIIETLKHNQYLAVFFNNADPNLDKNVRQALNYVLDKPEGEQRAKTPIPSNSWAYNRTVKEYLYDRDNAITLLMRTIPKQKMTIELATVPNFQAEAERVKESWEVLGEQAANRCKTTAPSAEREFCPNLQMTVQLRITNVPDLSQFQALLIAQESPPDPDQYYLWHSTQTTNFTQYKNPQVDKLLEDGRKTLDEKERRSIYLDFQQNLVEDSPAIFLQHITLYTIRRI